MAINIMETINVKLRDGYPISVCHTSQYDAGRKIRLRFYDDWGPYEFGDNMVVSILVRRPDGEVASKAAPSVSQGDTSITFTTTSAMTALPGKNKCEVRILIPQEGSIPDLILGTGNFIMDVEPDPLYGSIPGNSPINTLDKQIEEIVEEIVGPEPPFVPGTYSYQMYPLSLGE